MMNNLWAKVLDLGLSEADVVAFSAPLAFDISIWQMLAPLLVGGRLSILSDRDISFPSLTLSVLRRSGVTVAQFVPTAVRLLLDRMAVEDGLPGLRWLISTGEELPSALAGRVLEAMPRTRLLNAYGPTECSDHVTHYEVRPQDVGRARIPLGIPVANSSLYVLVKEGDSWRAAREGEPGELFAGGVVVGVGYADDEEATMQAFYLDTLDPQSPTGRLYRTGDAAAIRDGLIYFLGRLDRHVKVAGIRIELGEIESIIGRHPAVAQCAVVVDSSAKEGQLAAFYVAGPDAKLAPEELLARFSADLPGAIVPKVIERVRALPVTANGKVDYDALALRARRGGAPPPYQPTLPKKEIERLHRIHEISYRADLEMTGSVQTFSYGDRPFLIPPQVHPLGPLSHLLGDAVLTEVRDGDRVLDMGTGCGLHAVLAATRAADVLAVDVNPHAVDAARHNAELNGVADRVHVRQSDVFSAVDGLFDLIVFNPPFRWFTPRDPLEMASADPGYRALTTFFRNARRYLTAAGRILVFFGTSGDLNYLQRLLDEENFTAEILSRYERSGDDWIVQYLTFRLT
jgi:methylase of polypeptide subunit release factors